MNKKKILKTSLLLGSVLSASQLDAKAEGLFDYSELGTASSVRNALSGGASSSVNLDLACGGNAKTEKTSDHKCGEGKCGGKKGKNKDHKCGEGKCGDKKGKHKDHKCGEGKCGGKKKDSLAKKIAEVPEAAIKAVESSSSEK